MGIGDWGFGPIPQTPNPNPQTPNPKPQKIKIYIKLLNF